MYKQIFKLCYCFSFFSFLFFCFVLFQVYTFFLSILSNSKGVGVQLQYIIPFGTANRYLPPNSKPVAVSDCSHGIFVFLTDYSSAKTLHFVAIETGNMDGG